MVLELYPDLELTPQKWPYIDTHMVIKILDGSSSKNIWLLPQLYISGIHYKIVFKKTEFTAENGVDQQ